MLLMMFTCDNITKTATCSCQARKRAFHFCSPGVGRRRHAAAAAAAATTAADAAVVYIANLPIKN